MARIATSIEESKRLLELGIDPNSADMCWDYVDECKDDGNLVTIHNLIPYKCSKPKDIPAWSLGALIKVYLMLDNNARITFDNRDDGNDLIASMVYAIEHCLKAKTSS